MNKTKFDFIGKAAVCQLSFFSTSTGSAAAGMVMIMYDLKTYLRTIDEVISRGPFKDTWESLSAYKVPDWYRNAKFGIFVHWGIFSVPAFGNEWYPRNMYIPVSYTHLSYWKRKSSKLRAR